MAADMGGMGFIESNQSVLMYNNTLVSSNMLEVRTIHTAKSESYDTQESFTYNNFFLSICRLLVARELRGTSTLQLLASTMRTSSLTPIAAA